MSVDVARRLEAIDRRAPRQDREAAEAALGRFFRLIGSWRPKVVRWHERTWEGWAEARVPMEDGDRDWYAFESRVVGPAMRERLDPERWWDGLSVDRDDPADRAVRAAWTDGERELFLTLDGFNPLRGPFGECAPIRSPAILAARLVDADDLLPADRRALIALLEAAEAGLWLFWPRRDQTSALMRPSIHAEDGRLHRWDGPAVTLPGGSCRHYWRGVLLPPGLPAQWEKLGLQEILHEWNVEVRRVMLERFGWARFLRELRAEPLCEDAWGRLYWVEVDDEPIVLVRVVNSTPEPDGSRREYVLRVPPEVRSPKEAVAWTFGMQAGEYVPLVQT